jgi:glycosyltransferase involved in cell wall biosynthesis
MHDIQQVHFPEFFDKDQLKDRYVHYNLSAEYVSYMQASSEFIGQDFLDYFIMLKKEQVEVINEGVDIPVFREPRDVKHICMKYAIPESYLFFPAQLWLHKNHITVLKALKDLHAQGITIPLVLTGAQYSAARQIFDFVKEHKMNYVHYLGKVPFDDLVALYQGAKFMITAVLYESSSLPVLEAAAAGTPVIASATPPNVELSRRLAINLFEPLDVPGLTKLLSETWNNDQLIASQKASNLQNISYYSWNNVASRYLEFFERIVRKKN